MTRMKFAIAVCSLTLMAILSIGCASGSITSDRIVNARASAPPDGIVVWDFAVSAEDVARNPALARAVGGEQEPIPAEEHEAALTVAKNISLLLVDDLNERGLTASRGTTGGSPAEGDLIVHGAFVSVDEGSRAKRMLIGFGAGASEVTSHVTVSQVRNGAPLLLEEFEVTADSGSMPGMAVPVGAGAAAGNVATSVVVSGGLSTAREIGGPLGTESKNTAKQIGERLQTMFTKRGWSVEE